jgi:hypothetical protein
LCNKICESRSKTNDQRQSTPAGIYPDKLDLTANYDNNKGFDSENKDKIKTVGIHPNKLDLTTPIYLTVTL